MELKKYCGVEQRPAREPHKLKVGGSNPSAATSGESFTSFNSLSK